MGTPILWITLNSGPIHPWVAETKGLPELEDPVPSKSRFLGH